MRVLDVCGGLGDPARTLASEFDCAVEVLDLTEDFCRAGGVLTARTGLGGRVSFRHGDALEMPYPDDAAFDLAWTQHSSMNIADKGRLYAEIHRVLRPDGRLAMHEMLAGPVSPPSTSLCRGREIPASAICAARRGTRPPQRNRL